MSCVQLLDTVERSVQTRSNTQVFFPMTPWMPATGLTIVNVAYRLEAEDGSFEVQPGYQLAEVKPDEPSAPSTFGTARTSNDYYFDTTSSIATSGSFYIRYGLFTRSTVAATHAFGQVALTVSTRRCGAEVGRVSRTLNTFADTSNAKVLSVSSWIPAVAITKAKLGAIFTGIGAASSFAYRFVYRTAEDDTASPGAWTGLDGTSSFSTPTGTNDTVVQEESFTTELNDKMWVQFGMEYRASGTSPARATVTAMAAVEAG